MITNPYLPSPPAAAAWSQGFVRGLAGSEFSISPPADMPPYEAAAFAEGLLAGQDGAINGIAFEESCVLAEDSNEAGHLISTSVVAGETLQNIIRMAFRMSFHLAGHVVYLIELAITLPKHTMPPDQVLPNLGEPLVETLASYGVESMEFYCAAGLDATKSECEILLSPLFRTLDQARNAALAMGRQQWLIASWRTDQSGSFKIVEQS
jgi:hypothetical protein